ncbi:MAG: nitrous oxide reductase accessory protein NosL [Gemmatimonadetes bacterium]|nr:nitrous oxide reductase accessory protein NosL [Gemmatimonadota bacterium]
MMTKGSRVVVLLAALALGLVYVLPVWRITLEAPQYPEGLGMVIEIDDVVGEKPHDLANINNLNHYIGMKRIEPDSIPELTWMPLILGGLIALGLLAALVGRRWLLYGWVAVFLTVSVVGLVDFWKWEYDYGHDLDQETAIIKIPGMSYQPPLIGSRQILNFKAHSWPGSGGWIAIAAALAGVGVAVGEVRRGRREGQPVAGPESATGQNGSSGLTTGALSVALLSSSLAMAGCGEPAPRALSYGVDTCEHCHMGLAEMGHGAEAVLETGRVHVFDSVECLAGWLAGDAEHAAVHSLWVVDFSEPTELVRVEDAHFLRSPTLASPMGLGLTAFARSEDRDGAVDAFGGDSLDWPEVRAWVDDVWPEGRVRMPTGHAGDHGAMLMPASR